jgi:hypothetical protein
MREQVAKEGALGEAERDNVGDRLRTQPSLPR